MATRVALVTPAPLDRPFGDSLRPRMQALGLWTVGWRDFVVYTASPDPTLPFPQERIRPLGPLQLVPPVRHGCRLVHAHQNSGLFQSGLLWIDLHGLAPLEARLNCEAHPGAVRPRIHAAFSTWATRRLLHRCGRVICAGRSIADNLQRWQPHDRPVTILQNTIDPDAWPETDRTDARVLVIGGFTNRWGRTSLPIALEVARLLPQVRFRLVGAIDDGQLTECRTLPNVDVEGPLADADYANVMRTARLTLLPFADWCRGGGTRQKLIQSAASGHAIVASPPALEGVDDPADIFVGSDPRALADHIAQLIDDLPTCEALGRRLRAAFLLRHDFMAEAQRLAELYEAEKS